MNSMFRKAFIIASTVICLPFIMKGQVGSEEVKVVAPYQPTISDAYKINENPQILETGQIDIPDLDYTIRPRLLETKFELEPIRPARMIGEPLSKLYKSYAKIGYGNYKTPFAEFFYHNLRSKRHSYGVHLKHLSSAGNIKDKEKGIEYAGATGKTGISVFGKKFIEGHTLSGNLDFDHKTVHFYGYDPDRFPQLETMKKDSIKQHFINIGFDAQLLSTYADKSKLKHQLNLKYYNLSDNYNAGENHVGISAKLAKDISIIAYDLEQLRLNAGIQYYNNSNDIFSHDNALVRINPHYTAIFKDFTFTVGTNAFVTADTVSDLYFFPDIDLDVALVEKVLVLYAGLNGDATRNSFKSFSDENPFIISDIPVEYTLDKLSFAAGIKGSFSSILSYDLGIEKTDFEQMPFFVNDTTYYLDNRFNVVYDNGEVLNVKAHFASQVKEKVKMLLKADFYEYTLENELEPWHRPTLTLDFGLQYNLRDKFLLNFNLLTYNERYARMYNAQNDIVKKKLLGAVDMNFGIDYRYSKVLSVFLKLNNIEGVSHYEWNYYPTQKFNMLGGISYAF